MRPRTLGLLLLVLGSSASAQDLHYLKTNPVTQGSGAFMGSQVIAIGDSTGDGFPDWATYLNGGIQVYSGATGVPTLALHPPSHDDVQGLEGVGDINLDGFPDIAFGSGLFGSGSTTNQLLVHSATDGALLFSWSHPSFFVATGLGDVNLDGTWDIGARESHSLIVISGASQSPISTIPTPNVSAYSEVAPVPDLDGDGLAEIAIGDSSVVHSPTSRGEVRFRRLDGTTHSVWTAGPLQRELGRDLSKWIGDLDGDNEVEIASGSWVGQGTIHARVDVYSPKLGTILYSLVGPDQASEGFGSSPGQFGRTIAGAGDVDGDGTSDVIVTATSSLTAVDGVLIYSGDSGALIGSPLLSKIDNGSPWDSTYGHAVAGLGDIDGDSLSDIAISSITYPGSVAVVACRDRVDEFGEGCPGTLGVTPALGGTLGSNSVSLRVQNGLSGSVAYLAVGIHATSVQINNWCELHVKPVHTLVPIPLDGQGLANVTIPLPPGFQTCSMLQAFVVDPGAPSGFSATNGLQLTIH